MKLRKAIRAYWAARGHAVSVRVEHNASADSKGGIYVVRSDMLNGLPRAP